MIQGRRIICCFLPTVPTSQCHGRSMFPALRSQIFVEDDFLVRGIVPKKGMSRQLPW